MIGIGPEFDHLTLNLNLMIERQAAAVDGLRQVSTAIAHELRTPLSRLKQRLESMRDSEGVSPAALDEAIGQIDGTLSTFQSLLRISMLEGGAGRQRFGPVDLTELMDRVHQVYLPVAEDSGHMLLADSLSQAIVGGDGELLAQLLTNLVENGLSHTPPGTRIWLSLRGEEQAVVLSVRDDGPGVAPEDRDKLFTKFYRAAGHGNTSGAGLGLSLVAAIADLHGAVYQILPSRPGFCVEVTFPAIQRDET
jgi:signal transduction histidine kinase